MPKKSRDVLPDLARELGPLPLAGAAVPFVLRGIAVLQALGALLGVSSLLADATLAPLDVFSGVALVGFALVLRLAFGVWRGAPRAIGRMQWVLGAQIPWLNWHALVHYDLYFALACTLRLGNAAEPLELGIGSSFNAYLGSTPDSAFLGVNLGALALLLLFRSASRSWNQTA